MIQRKMPRSREYTAKIVKKPQRHDFIHIWMPTGRPAPQSYEARIMIDSTSAPPIRCWVS